MISSVLPQRLSSENCETKPTTRHPVCACSRTQTMRQVSDQQQRHAQRLNDPQGADHPQVAQDRKAHRTERSTQTSRDWYGHCSSGLMRGCILIVPNNTESGGRERGRVRGGNRENADCDMLGPNKNQRSNNATGGHVALCRNIFPCFEPPPTAHSPQ